MPRPLTPTTCSPRLLLCRVSGGVHEGEDQELADVVADLAFEEHVPAADAETTETTPETEPFYFASLLQARGTVLHSLSNVPARACASTEPVQLCSFSQHMIFRYQLKRLILGSLATFVHGN